MNIARQVPPLDSQVNLGDRKGIPTPDAITRLSGVRVTGILSEIASINSFAIDIFEDINEEIQKANGKIKNVQEKMEIIQKLFFADSLSFHESDPEKNIFTKKLYKQKDFEKRAKIIFNTNDDHYYQSKINEIQFDVYEPKKTSDSKSNEATTFAYEYQYLNYSVDLMNGK
ncbi:hypothetical protein TRFO_40379 [Tritrichomonas foetus]|uniref:Uncharacterized protein n=1 Tax=Tritrichomonas foetus TaxID=1144522 RepID=A0A1J4J167_9EUKA|nr:hypothetical protein TRFO_40379 [Tritrichomonas foetus]|eukprot:OHS93342.1 hypothetical protein TRFO_40379 [Tritrichomonas foetus]